MQNLFEPVIPDGLSLIDIDIVRRRMRGEASNVGGRGVEASSRSGANTTRETPVVSGQATRITEVSALATLQRGAEQSSFTDVEKMSEYTQQQIQEREERRKQLLETNGSKEEIDRLNKEISALTNNRNVFQNVTAPGRKLQVASNKYPHLRSVFTFIEFAPHLMTRMFLEEPSLDAKEKNKYEVNNNLKYSLNPLEATLTLPGISGIRIGELVRLGRMPKRLFENRGAWQILGITDTINSDGGWITNLRCRFMPLPPIVVNSLTDI
jgi:hypothetical protein